MLVEVFRELSTPDIDMFASRNNHQLQCYITREFGSKAERARMVLSLNWQNINGYFFPPFRVLLKLEGERATGVLKAPNWATQPWYPLLRQLVGLNRAQQLRVKAGTLTLRGDKNKQFPLTDKMELLAVRLQMGCSVRWKEVRWRLRS